jgi:flagellar FliL protein
MLLKHRPGKTILLLLIGCGLFAMAVGVGIGMFMSKRAQASNAHPGTKKGQKKEAKGPVETVYSLGEQVVNLADTSTLRYAKLTVALGIRERLSEEQVKEFEPMLKDAVIGVVTKRRFDEVHRKGGLQRVKGDILVAMQGRVPNATIAEVYFEQFAMQ